MGHAADRTSLLMAAEMSIPVYGISYSLSPEARYPVARDECLAVYRALLKQYSPNNILAMGSSSGGQLLLSTLLRAREDGFPMPRKIFLCSPAVDMTGSGDSLVFNEGRDIMPTCMLRSMVEQNYFAGGEDPKDPLISPLFGDWKGMSPVVIVVGTRDSLLSPGVKLFWKLRADGVDVELLVGEGGWHGYVWDQCPEGIETRTAVRGFFSR